jgi:hypothetical protein
VIDELAHALHLMAVVVAKSGPDEPTWPVGHFNLKVAAEMQDVTRASTFRAQVPSTPAASELQALVV